MQLLKMKTEEVDKMSEWDPIDWVEFDDDFDKNEKRAKNIVQKYRFDFDNIPKQDVRELIKQEIENNQEGCSEYIRVLCGYLYCIGDCTDIALLEQAKYGINMDVGCMVDGEWIDSLKCNNADGQREDIIQYFCDYYRAYLEE